MKKNYERPFLTVSVFASENVVTASSDDITKSTAYVTTVENIAGDDKLVNDQQRIFTFYF